MYTNKIIFNNLFPCLDELSSHNGHIIRSFIGMVDLPAALNSENHNNFKWGVFKRLIFKFGIWFSYKKPYSPWQNRSKPPIGDIKRHTHQLMEHTSTLIWLWWFCYKYSADLLLICTIGTFDLQGFTPIKVFTNYTPKFLNMLPLNVFIGASIFMRNKRANIFFYG